MESGAGADGALDMNLAGMLLDDAVGDGKTQAGAAAVAGFGHGLGGEKRIVDALEVLGSDAGAGVGDQGRDVAECPFELRFGGYPQPAAVGHGFFGVEQQIEKDLLQLAGVAVDRRQVLGQFEIDDDLARF